MFERVNRDDVPRRERKSESKFESTKEWAELKKALSGPKLTKKESLKMSFTDGEMDDIGLSNIRTIHRFVKKHVEGLGLDYKVKAFQFQGRRYIVVERNDA